MQNNFLEELVSEWLEYTGYIVKRNERIGQFVKGGQGELDVVAFDPKKNRLIHVEAETSTFVVKPRKDMHSRNVNFRTFAKRLTWVDLGHRPYSLHSANLCDVRSFSRTCV